MLITKTLILILLLSVPAFAQRAIDSVRISLAEDDRGQRVILGRVLGEQWR